MGAVVSFVGLYASYKMDTPTGAMVVCTFGAALIFLALGRMLIKRNSV
jgi:ABC-type Mn2+/Zn2+ transport system permease subunit